MISQQHWSEDPGRLLPKTVAQLEGASAARLTLDRLILRLYYGRPLAVPTLDPRRPSYALAVTDSVRAGGFSLMRMVIDTAASMVVRIPAVKVLPVGQTFKRQRAARLMGRFVNGVFYANDIGDLAYQVFIDACTTRCGAIKVSVENGAIKLERVDPLTLYWDQDEGKNPRNLYQDHAVPRRSLAARFPEHAAAIMELPGYAPPQMWGVDLAQPSEKDTVRVVEAWSLTEGDQKGKHVIYAAGKGGAALVLESEAYDHERHCIVPLRWSNAYKGFGGRPLGETIIPYQLWTNKIVKVIGESLDGAVPRWLVHANAQIPGVTSVPLSALIYRGNVAPKCEAPQVVSADLYTWQRELKMGAFEEAGINAQASQGTRPTGLNSAPSQREWFDISNTRLINPSKLFEHLFRDVARVVVMLGPKAKVTALDGRTLSELRWDEIGPLKEGEYGLEIQSVSALPLTVSGRLDFVKELMSEGLINQNDGRRMLQLPDLEAVLDRENAAQELADRQIECALWDGKYIAPFACQNLLDLVIDGGEKQYMQAMLNGTFPAENMELLRRLIAEAKLLRPAPAPVNNVPPAPPAQTAPAMAAAA